MIGNPKWFQRRKYSGWGLTPATWQGWAYILVIILPVVIMNQIQVGKNIQTFLLFSWIGIFCIDIIDIMIHLKKDEREQMHEALAERNASWTMIAILAFGVAYQSAQSIIDKSSAIDPFLIVVLIGGMIGKAATNWYLRNK